MAKRREITIVSLRPQMHVIMRIDSCAFLARDAQTLIHSLPLHARRQLFAIWRRLRFTPLLYESLMSTDDL